MTNQNNVNPEEAVILVVEDNKLIAREMFILLSRVGYQVVIACNGAEALQAAVIHNPDLVLLDVLMPDMNGFEVCRRLRDNPATAELPVIFMTALSDLESKVRGFELGAIDYVTKPIHNAELQARLTTHLTLINLRRGLQHEIREREKLIGDLDAYAHTVAHDLKGTMNNVIGFAHMLVKNGDRLSQETRNQALETIMQHSYKMRDIIDALLLLANVRQENIVTEEITTGEIIKDVLSRLKLEIETTNAVIALPEEWPTAVAYAPWIAEVWFNYLSNAIKYGGMPPQIQVGADTIEDGFIRFWVQDNGSGVPLDYRDQVFQPFTRLHQSDIQGHGLGLSIVHRIVEKLGGQVGVTGEPGSGATFFFTLPSKNNEG